MLERAKEFLQVAELAMEKGLHNGCAANCYYEQMSRRNGRFSKRRLQQHISELTSIAKNLAPDIEITEVLIPGYEDLDAWIDIVVPDEMEEIVSETLSQRRYEIFTEEGYDIGLGITERSQYEAVQSKLSVTV
ncbi:hypothetical protein L0337_01130 [candidate division KSB1 bacterium]|nr:hypothetical protein [candidate division KSB1 bacterium]